MPDGRPLRVAHLTTVDMSLALLLETELRYDVEAGCETFGLSAPGPYVPRVEALGVSHVPLPSLTRSWNLGRDLRAVRELIRVLRDLRPDVLHVHNPKTGVMGRIIGRLLRVPVVVNTCHGLWASPSDRRRRKAAVYSAEVFAARFSHAELFQNATDLRTLGRWIDPAKATVVGNGTDLDRFAVDDRRRRDTRADLGVDDDTLLIGGVGRMVAEKGIAEFVEAAEILRAEHGARLAFVWVGPADEDKPDAYAAANGAVRFLGSRDDMPDLYNALDVFVLPSYREGFSRSAMEAAACGKAMVLSDIRGCREIGEHGTHLLLSPAGDGPALAVAIDRLVQDAALRDRLGSAALERARAEFDQRRVAAVSLATYHRVAASRGLGWA